MFLAIIICCASWWRAWTASLLASLLLFLSLLATSAQPSMRREGRRTQAQLTSGNLPWDEKNISALKQGKPVERELAAGQADYYQLTLAVNQYAKVVIEQRGIDVAITLFAPDGKKLAKSDSPYGAKGTESILYIAETPGEYRLEVRALDFNPFSPGRYEIKLEELRDSVSQDKTRIAAWKAFSEAEHLRYNKTAEAQRRALSLYEEALALCVPLAECASEALALRGIGDLYKNLGNKEKALHYYNRALQIQISEGNSDGKAQTLQRIGNVYVLLERYEQALDYFESARKIYRSSNLPAREILVLLEISMAYSRIGDYQKARYYWDEALKIRMPLDNQGGKVELPPLTSEIRGDNQKLLDYYERVLQIKRSTGDRLGEAQTLGSLGAVCLDLSNNQKAIDYFNRALLIYRTLRDSADRNRPVQLFEEVDLLSLTGEAYFASGDKQKALDYFNQALQEQRAYQDILSKPTENSLLYKIGKVYHYQGEKQRASEYYRQALSLNLESINVIERITLSHLIGDDYVALGEKPEALDYFNLALSLSRDAGNRNGEAAAHYKLARVERDRGNLIEARAQIEATLNLVESLRARLANQELRTSYFASVQDYYKFYIDLLMQLHKQQPSQGYDAAALWASERARARSLLELLTEARVGIRQGIDPTLLEREHELQQQLHAKSERQVRLRSVPPKDQTEAVKSEIAALENELESLVAEYQRLETQIRIKNPRYTAMTQPQPASLKEIQGMLDHDTLLLEYSLGEEHSYVWVITSGTLNSFELPKRAEIEAVARRVYESLTERNRSVKGETPEARRARVEKGDTQYTKSAAALSEMILKPVSERLQNKRLVIISDGALQYIPFAALPIPPATAEASVRAKTPPLIVEHEIVNLPSATTLIVVRRELEGRKPAAKTVAVLADPVFDKDDERVKVNSFRRSLGKSSKPAPAPGITRDLERAFEDLNETNPTWPLTRLYGTRQEARQIISIVPATEGFQALDFAANRQTATSAQMGQYRILHFATHALINTAHPDLSGIVLSLVDERGQPQDGFLHVQEIFNLVLPAELVVLSACRTGLGKLVKGEGFIGLTRGFMYAGTPRIIVSIWSVDDRATSELMVRFYKKMLGIERKSPAAALQAAQTEMLKDVRWQSPYFWAGYTFQGEWRQSRNVYSR
jgi:CHAT domain-containing protein/predicted negative regulator of RcsB-dependent stress response